MYNNDPKYTDPPEAGLASLLASRGQGGDSMLVHMAPEEVNGLRQLAMAHGGDLEVNPHTGLYQANILKKILPMVIGAILPSVPGIGRFASGIGEFLGASGTAASTLGTGLLVGGVTGLIEGDLKKGLMAGLGAYSGANLAQALQGASIGAGIEPEKISAEELAKTNQAMEAAKQTVGAKPVYNPTGDAEKVGIDFFQSANRFKGTPTVGDLDIGRQAIATGATRPDQILDFTKSANAFRTPIADAAGKITGYNALQGTPTAADLTAGRAANIAGTGVGGVGRGIASLVQSPQGRGTFINRLGGGFESPFMQSLSRNATLMGVMDAFTPEYEMPSGGDSGDDTVYMAGDFNPMYGYGREYGSLLPGKYYKRTKQGLVPYNPYAMAPGYAEGGPVDDEDEEDYPPVGVAPPSSNPFAQAGAPVTSPPPGPEPSVPPPVVLPPDGPPNPFGPARQRYLDMVNAPPPPPVDTKPTMDYLDELSRRAKKPEFMVFPPGGYTGGTGGDPNRPPPDKPDPDCGPGYTYDRAAGACVPIGSVTNPPTPPKPPIGPPGTTITPPPAPPKKEEPKKDEPKKDEPKKDEDVDDDEESLIEKLTNFGQQTLINMGLSSINPYLGLAYSAYRMFPKSTQNRIKKLFGLKVTDDNGNPIPDLTEAEKAEEKAKLEAEIKAAAAKAEADKKPTTPNKPGGGGVGIPGGGGSGRPVGGGTSTGGGTSGRVSVGGGIGAKTYYRNPDGTYEDEDGNPVDENGMPIQDARVAARTGGRIRAMQAGGLPTPPNPYGAAVGEDYNFGFSGGGEMPTEYLAGGKLLEGPGDGMSDSIPAVIRGKGVQRAALADGEFVIPADVVSHLGNGSTKAGAKKLYQMMAQIRQARTGKTRQAPAVKPDRFLPA